MGRSGDAIFRRVLVPTDFSPDSEQALVLAQRVAAALDSELTLLHVLPVTPLDVDREAAWRTAAAAHQLGILRADQLPATHEGTFEGPLRPRRFATSRRRGRRGPGGCRAWPITWALRA